MAKAKTCPAMSINGNRLGLALGGTFAVLCIIWAVMVKIGVAAKFLDWCLGLKSINLAYGIYPFYIGNAVFSVIMAFVFGYVVGWIFAMVWHCVEHKCRM